MMLDTLLSRELLLAEREAQHREQGAAALDGSGFDARRLREIEQQLQVWDDAEAESARRQAEAAEASKARRRAAAIAQLAEHHEARLSALGRAEAAAVQMVAELAAARLHAAATVDVMRTLKAQAGPFERREIDIRHGRMVAEILRPIASNNSSLGDLEWHLTPFNYESWVSAEIAATTAAIAAASKEQDRG